MKLEERSEVRSSKPIANADSTSAIGQKFFRREFPVGAEFSPSIGTHFRVWAPKSRRVKVQLLTTLHSAPKESAAFEMEAEANGCWSTLVKEASPGMLYKFQLDSGSFPDPASRFQPDGPHGPSEIVSPLSFQWTDRHWRGVPRQGQVIYEMHIGTFTPEGTWRAAQEQLAELASLGITVVELMPIADFPGRFGWGYDGVNLFAPTRLYGAPDDFRAFVNCAHGLGLGVILDVVYNHVGPDGNYLKEYSDDFFTTRYENEWGEPLNFDGENSGPVREFFIANAVYWIKEYHLDGLRLDATQQIFDASTEHILSAVTKTARNAVPDRSIYIIGENEPQQARLVWPCDRGGHGLDALWNDDFHHCAMVGMTGRREAYYIDYRGTPQEFISAAKWGFLYQGQWYSWQKKPRGSYARDLLPEQFVNFLQNHDQVANSLHGSRIHQLGSLGNFRALTALLLLGPGTPMLFQGQEFAASTPFLYFADHARELAHMVAQGRREFLDQFPAFHSPDSESCLAAPHAEETFLRSKLNLSERQKNDKVLRLHKDLLRLRREDPTFSRPRHGAVDGAVLGDSAFVLRFFGQDKQDRLLLVNLGHDLTLSPAPEPLLAPVEGHGWGCAWCSESPLYGGSGAPLLQTDVNWRVLGNAASVLVPAPLSTRPPASGQH